MRRMIIFVLSFVVLTGCAGRSLSEKNTGEGNKTATESETAKEEISEALEEEGTEAEVTEDYDPMSIEERKDVIRFLEMFEEGTFSDMDKNQAASYGEPITEYYDFWGRESEDGRGYVLAFRKSAKNPLKNLSIYGLDGYTEAERWDEKEDEYDVVYSFKKTGCIVRGEADKILVLQPIDMEESEALIKAFGYRFCSGEEGIQYLQDVMERGVRFTPPATEAYLAANRYENGRQYWEYAVLTSEEEQEILNSGDMVDSDLYGEYGLQFFASQETYENGEEEESEITAPVLEIAKKKFRFEIAEPKDIHDIVKAELSMCVWKDGNGGEEVDTEKDQRPVVATEALTDPLQLKELEKILAGAQNEMEGKCPYTGVLTLTREDGTVIHVSLATDSCDGFILGSHGVYSVGKENTERIWELFPEIREYTGWAVRKELMKP